MIFDDALNLLPDVVANKSDPQRVNPNYHFHSTQKARLFLIPHRFTT